MQFGLIQAFQFFDYFQTLCLDIPKIAERKSTWLFLIFPKTPIRLPFYSMVIHYVHVEGITEVHMQSAGLEILDERLNISIQIPAKNFVRIQIQRVANFKTKNYISQISWQESDLHVFIDFPLIFDPGVCFSSSRVCVEQTFLGNNSNHLYVMKMKTSNSLATSIRVLISMICQFVNF